MFCVCLNYSGLCFLDVNQIKLIPGLCKHVMYEKHVVQAFYCIVYLFETAVFVNRESDRELIHRLCKHVMYELHVVLA